MKFKLAIFDWNGTLLDDLQVYYHSMTEIFASFNLPAPPLEQVREVSDFLAFYHRNGVPQQTDWNQLDKIREAVYRRRWQELRLHNGAVEALKYCRTNGLATAIVSGELTCLLGEALKKFQLAELLNHVRGDAWPKEPELRKTMERFDAQPDETIFIDDNLHGLEAGRKIGLVTVGAAYGYMRKNFLAKAEPNFFINSLTDLLPLIA